MTSRFIPSFSFVLIAHLVLILGSWQLFNNDQVASSINESMKVFKVQVATENLTARPAVKAKPLVSKTIPTPAVKPAPIAKEEVAQDLSDKPSSEAIVTGAVNIPGAEHEEVADAKTVFKNELRAKIEENKYYPPMSRRLGHSGIVTVAFTLLDDGHIINIRLDQPSRYELLNESALTAVKKVHKFKPIPREWNMGRMDIKVPIKFYTI